MIENADTERTMGPGVHQCHKKNTHTHTNKTKPNTHTHTRAHTHTHTHTHTHKHKHTHTNTHTHTHTHTIISFSVCESTETDGKHLANDFEPLLVQTLAGSVHLCVSIHTSVWTYGGEAQTIPHQLNHRRSCGNDFPDNLTSIRSSLFKVQAVTLHISERFPLSPFNGE